jgi:CheY-like chemotaxis protein
MNGWEFIESLNENIPFDGSRLKGIILSSSVDPADIEKSKEYPRVVHYLTKPFTIETASTIQHWID